MKIRFNQSSLKIRTAQLNPIIGDLGGNTDKIIKIISDTLNSDTDLLIFPETCITGYPPKDLLDKSGFIESQNEWLSKIIKSTVSNSNLFVVIGAYSFNQNPGKKLYNSLYVINNGKIVLCYNKVCLPTYNIFDEYRHTEPGSMAQSNVLKINGSNVGFLICEDALSSYRDINNPLYNFNPVDALMTSYNGINVLVTINASPSNHGKFNLRNSVFKKICQQHNITSIYVNQCGSNDDVIFDGQSFIMNQEGELITVHPMFSESFIDTDLSKENKEVYVPTINVNKDKFIYQHLVFGIQEYFHKQGFKKAVVGSSGGIDSAVVLALAVSALGKENVTAITMPSKVSSDGSVSDSGMLCKNLGIQLHNFPIGDAYNNFFGLFYDIFGNSNADITEQNLQARLRSNILFAYSNKFGSLVLNTSNKTEMAVGYGTLYGDISGALGVIGDIYKTEVFSLARYINKVMGNVIPEAIISKEPSAELAPGQKDSDDLPGYDLLDPIVKLYIEGDFLEKEEVDNLKSIISEANISKEYVQKVLNRIDKNDFKRGLFPTLRVSIKSFGFGRQIPIVKKSPITNKHFDFLED